MKANELRIGNLLYYHSTNLVGTVSLISDFVFDCRNEIGSFTPNCKYDPIPLTEEILLKCGFFYDVDCDTYKVSDCTLQIDLSDFETAEAIVFAESLGYIKYLHQLQNLYFALTGKELDVKL